MKRKSFLERIRSLEKLTSSEAKVEAFFESNYPLTAFETITSVSKKAGVGTATVGRFLKRLGYSGFPEFMQEIRKDVVNRLQSPIDRYSARRSQISVDKTDYFQLQMNHALKNIQETYTRMEPERLRKAADIMASCKGNLYVLGTATSQALAFYFFLLTKYMRQRVVLLDANFSTIRHQLVDAGPQDVLLAVTHYRFSNHTAKIARWFAARKGRVIVIADRENNPMSDIADFQFFTRSEGPPLFNSRIAALMVLESLLMAMAPILESQMYQRFEVFEELREFFDTHPPWPFGTSHDLMNSGKEK